MTERDARKPWYPGRYEVADIKAIQAVALGEGTAEQQRRALDWIIMQAAATYDNGFLPNDAHGRIAAFLDGRQFVGQQVVKLMKLKAELFKKEDEE